MRLIKIVCCLLMISLISGCKSSYPQLKMNKFDIEVGNPIIHDATCYFDLEGYSEEEKNDIKRASKFEITNISEVIDEGKKYEQVGTYIAKITYYQKEYNFDIEVKDHRAPVINGPDKISVTLNENYDFESKFKAHDYSEVKYLNVDSSRINIHKKGVYDLYIEASDFLKNINSKTVKVYVGMKPEVPESIYMDVPYYNQLDANAPNGCETTALYMALNYKGKITEHLESFIKNQPKSITPYEGFSGDPFSHPLRKDDYYTIFPAPLIKYGNQYSKCRDISRSSLESIKYELSLDHPVIVYVTSGLNDPVMEQHYFGKVTSNLHIVLLNGFDNNKKIFYVKDPIDKTITEVDYEQFEKLYNTMKFAIAIE